MTRVRILLSNGMYFIPIQKNGCTSVKEHRADFVNYPADEPGTAVIRNPLDRLESCWANQWRNLPCDDWEAFIDYVCNTPDEKINVHAVSQSAKLIDGDTLVPFDEMNGYFEDRGITLKVLNRSRHKGLLTDEQTERVRIRYKDDFILWDKLKRECNVQDRPSHS